MKVLLLSTILLRLRPRAQTSRKKGRCHGADGCETGPCTRPAEIARRPPRLGGPRRCASATVARRAGRSFETAEEAARGEGQLLVKGLKSTWRMAPLILRTTLAGALTRILMHADVHVRAAALVPHSSVSPTQHHARSVMPCASMHGHQRPLAVNCVITTL